MAAERSRWTDERLDDLARHMNDQYAELVARFDRLDGRLDRLDGRLDRLEDKLDRMRGELYNTRWTIVGIWLGLAAIFVEIVLRS